jgi:hypothetical protein
MIKFFFWRKHVLDADTPYNEFRDPYLEQIIEMIRADSLQQNKKLEDERQPLDYQSE